MSTFVPYLAVQNFEGSVVIIIDMDNNDLENRFIINRLGDPYFGFRSIAKQREFVGEESADNQIVKENFKNWITVCTQSDENIWLESLASLVIDQLINSELPVTIIPLELVAVYGYFREHNTAAVFQTWVLKYSQESTAFCMKKILYSSNKKILKDLVGQIIRPTALDERTVKVDGIELAVWIF